MQAELIAIQAALHAPKSQRNSFGNYNYRNCEDILTAVKPLLKEHGVLMTISDNVEMAGNWPVVTATVTLTKGTEVVSVTAQAGINPTRKGMDVAQSFGSSSSYARKYALNGLFLIDDTKDADSRDNRAENKA